MQIDSKLNRAKVGLICNAQLVVKRPRVPRIQILDHVGQSWSLATFPPCCDGRTALCSCRVMLPPAAPRCEGQSVLKRTWIHGYYRVFAELKRKYLEINPSYPNPCLKAGFSLRPSKGVCSSQDPTAREIPETSRKCPVSAP